MKDYWFTTDEETTARISEQRDNIYDYVIDRFKHLISNNDLNDALCLADEFFEWMNPETVSYTHLTLPTIYSV